MVSAIDMLMELYNMRVHINTNLKICGVGKEEKQNKCDQLRGLLSDASLLHIVLVSNSPTFHA